MWWWWRRKDNRNIERGGKWGASYKLYTGKTTSGGGGGGNSAVLVLFGGKMIENCVGGGGGGGVGGKIIELQSWLNVRKTLETFRFEDENDYEYEI